MVKKGHKFKGTSKYVGKPKWHGKGKASTVKKHARKGTKKGVASHKRKAPKGHLQRTYYKR